MRSNEKYYSNLFSHNGAGVSLLCSAIVALFLSACGGGGGSGGGNDGAAPTGQVPPSVPDLDSNRELALPDLPAGWETDAAEWALHEEYRRQPGLDQIKAAEAYARGITGRGVVIGFVDTGLDITHDEFGDKIIRMNDRSGLTQASDRQVLHGTGVASLALGNRGRGSAMHGVAFDADPAMWNLNLTVSGHLDINDEILARAARALHDSGARIINQSWGFATLLDPSLGETQKQFLQTAYGDFIDEMRRGEAVHVWAAGNSGGKEISVSTAWPLLFPELAGLSIAVAAIGADGIIGENSNRCGTAKNHCLVAPGGAAAGGSAYTSMANAGGGYRTSLGTSYAAPYVSGVLALMQQAYGNQLSLPEYTARLLATANKEGIYADEAIYGQGLVDAEAALTPQGDTHIPLPSGGLIAPHDGGVGGGLLPEEMLERLRRERIIILDDLNTPFAAQLALKTERSEDFNLSQMMTLGDDKANPYAHPALAHFAGFFDNVPRGQHWRLAPVSLRDNAASGNRLPQFGFGLTAIHTRHKSRLEMGLVAEQERLLGSKGSGALKLGNSHSALLGYAQDMQWGRMQIGFRAHLTFSHSEGDGASLINGTKGALASAFAVTFKTGVLHMELKQPTYFEQGDLQLVMPTMRSAGGGVIFEKREFAMRGARRPFRISFRYGDTVEKIGLRIEAPNGHDMKAGIGYFRRF